MSKCPVCGEVIMPYMGKPCCGCRNEEYKNPELYKKPLDDGSKESVTITLDNGNKLELTSKEVGEWADEHEKLDDEASEEAISKKSRVPASELFTSQDDGVSSDPNG